MSTSQQADPLIGRLVDGRYRVRARIARGGMATVYVATDMRLERRIALKVMHGHLSDDAVFQSRFIQEARAAARLADPHVVNVFDQGQDGDMAYLVMEYLPGITLRELLRQQRRLTVPQTITIMDAILSGLAAAHRADIMHRDVKPENVLLAEDGRIKIGDFGLARATTANTATGQMLLGTIAYLAPELVTRGTADARSDIYSLGIMLYEMLTGEQPFQGEQPMQIAYQHATDSVPRPSVKNPSVPESLDELVLWATERSPDDRPLNADEMLVRLRNLERDLGIAPQVARTLAVGTAIADEGLDSGELTRTMPGLASTTGPVEEDDNATRLRTAARRRAAKGGWLFALVMILTVLAAGTGWWFGSGPGSLVAVAQVSGLTYEEATARLAQDTLVTTETGRHSGDVEPGRVIETNPAAGARVDQDSTVEIIVSLGPQPHDIGALAGSTETDVTNALSAARVNVSATELIFSDQEQGTVLGVLVTPAAGGDSFDCTQGCTVLEGDSAALTVSLGPVPDVVGTSRADATSTLTEAGLIVSESAVEESSNSISEGDVIGTIGRDDGESWRPGDTVTLIVSTGPPLYPIPSDIVGLTRDEAVAALENAGFNADYAGIWNALPNGNTRVTATDPGAGAQRILGTTVYLQISATI